MTKQNKNIKAALSNINQKKKGKGKRLVVQEVKQRKQVGRPSQKDPSIEYVKISASIPQETKTQMKIALFTDFKHKHKTQDDFMNAAILHYISSKK